MVSDLERGQAQSGGVSGAVDETHAKKPWQTPRIILGEMASANMPGTSVVTEMPVASHS